MTGFDKKPFKPSFEIPKDLISLDNGPGINKYLFKTNFIVSFNLMVLFSGSYVNSGRFGVIVKGEYHISEKNDVLVAIKSIPYAFDWKLMDNFVKEIKAVQDLRPHPNVVKVYGVVICETFRKSKTTYIYNFKHKF
jgi:hypothetical protein